jgi:hypothetical protein
MCWGAGWTRRQRPGSVRAGITIRLPVTITELASAPEGFGLVGTQEGLGQEGGPGAHHVTGL